MQVLCTRAAWAAEARRDKIPPPVRAAWEALSRSPRPGDTHRPMKTGRLAAIWVALAAYLAWWLRHNPLPDGYQNEYLHIGNAFDLWGALTTWDVWHLRWFMYDTYWPWGLHAPAAPVFALFGPSRAALVSTNLLHLGVLLWGMARLARTFGAPLAPVLLALTPAVFGTLVRYEPNLAVMAWTAAGVACLVDSRGLRDRRWVVGWGLCLGVGLMLDRLSVAFFLGPAVLPLLGGTLGRDRRRVLRNLALALGVALLLTAAYYREFFLRHTDELLGQAPVGEIDAAGELTGAGGWLYYPLTVLDSQAGTVAGLAFGIGLCVGVFELVQRARRGDSWQAHAVLVAVAVVPVAFFTLIAKKQVFYTLPVLIPLTVFAGSRPWLAWPALLGGLWAFAVAGLGLPAAPAGVLGAVPAPFVEPRHTLARPPTFERWPIAPALAALPREPADLAAQRAAPPGADGPHIAVFSQDDRFFEGFLALAVREGVPGSQVRGLVLDPYGTHELFDHAQALLAVVPAGEGWPTQRTIEREMRADHYALDELPPAAERVEGARDQFEETARLPAGDLELVVWTRTRPAPTRPAAGGADRDAARRDRAAPQPPADPAGALR